MGEAITKSTRWSGRQAHHKIPLEVFNNSPLLQRLEKQGLFKLNGKGNGIMLPESLSKGTTRSKHKGYHREYNQVIMEIVDNIDKNSKCDGEKARNFAFYEFNNDKFIFWLIRSAELGNTQAQYDLAYIFFDHYQDSKDKNKLDEAEKWALLAQKNGMSITNLLTDIHREIDIAQRGLRN